MKRDREKLMRKRQTEERGNWEMERGKEERESSKYIEEERK